jgi:hypothetical protein
MITRKENVRPDPNPDQPTRACALARRPVAARVGNLPAKVAKTLDEGLRLVLGL